MFRNKNDQGLTLIELLITISVLAVVSAIALPVINNVVTSSNSNALQQSIKDAQTFIDKYSKSGVVIYDGLQTLSGYTDTDGDNVIEAGEKIDTLTLDSKYSISVTGSAQEGGSYTNGGVTAATITSSATGGSSTPAGPTLTSFYQSTMDTQKDFGMGSCTWVNASASGGSIEIWCLNAGTASPSAALISAITNLTGGETIEITVYNTVVTGTVTGVQNNGYNYVINFIPNTDVSGVASIIKLPAA